MNFLSGSFKIGRLFDITIRVHILFLLYIGFRLFDAARSSGGWQEELLFLGLLFGIVLLHEFGHCFGARLVGGEARDILMWPLGGLAYAHAPMRPWPQFVTVAAGPLVNVLLCALSAAIMLAMTHGEVRVPLNPLRPHYLIPPTAPPWLLYVALFYQVNLFILAFNLLPIYPLDGGQLFHAIIWPFVGLQRATIIACYVGLAGCMYFGVRGLREGGGGGMLFFIALFGGFTCWQRLQAARRGLLIEDSRFEVSYGPARDSRPWWQRVLGMRRRPPHYHDEPVQVVRAAPGEWTAGPAEREREDAELDRILRKVSERGLQSLTYVERQTLERISRERQQEERQFQRDTRL